MSDTCTSCHAPVLWCETTKGKRMPVDKAPDFVDGNVEVVDQGEGRPLLAVVHRQRPMAPRGTLHQSHFATCPHADQHRRRDR